ncbi:MAG: hypothetical protein IKH63_10865 [Prevotella sp.]|nr:hypothetical protein [Prevotella sp.]
MNIFACNNLEGKTIGGWKVGNQIVSSDKTDKYALFYEVRKDGGSAVMKVLNYNECHNGPLNGAHDRASLIARETGAFHFESSLAKECTKHRMGNVIRYIDSADIELSDYPIKTVSYIIYEMSEGKIGDFLKFSLKTDFVVDLGMLVEKLKSLHQVTKGVRQLHTKLIAHHNITPQSVEVFDANTLSKVGGLQKSRTHQELLHSPVSARLFDGDYTYAPPEAYFNYKMSEEMSTYYQIDNYMLGNLIVYYLSMMNLTTLISNKCPYSLSHWASKGADYNDVLPAIIAAFNQSIEEIKSSICVEELREPIAQIIEGLCHPVPEKRGYPGGFSKPQANADLQRVLSKLDVLYNKAQLILYTRKK